MFVETVPHRPGHTLRMHVACRTGFSYDEQRLICWMMTADV